MRIYQSSLGTVRIAPFNDLFQYAWEKIRALAGEKGPRTVALTGGSTPKAFYKWVREQGILGGDLQELYWTTSDERYVALESGESNQGNAWRELCAPLGIEKKQMLFWETEEHDPEVAIEKYRKTYTEKLGEGKAYNLCFLGMGDDGHTASLFPESSLLQNEPDELFSAVTVPEKGERLTVTAKGLSLCNEVIVMVSGEAKAPRLKEVFESTEDILSLPVRVLGRFPEKVTWLIDMEAGKLL